MARKFENFIDGFLEYTDNKGSSELYRKWAAIFTIGAALERKVWIKTSRGQLFPNQYIVLVGGAGIGKSLSTNIVYDLLGSLRTPETPYHLAPSSLTKASLIDALAGAERRIVRPRDDQPVTMFNSLTVVPNEFAVFVPSWETEFMSTLTDIWDCKHYSETRRTNKLHIEIENVQLNIFSATTPAQLTNLLPEGAWEQGFMSRIILIFSGEKIETDLFTELEFESELLDNLRHDISEIYNLYGERFFTDEAKEIIRAWAAAGGEPAPAHPKLIGYNARRAAHLLKLCLVVSVAETNLPEITGDHVRMSLDLLAEAEAFMPDIFKQMKVGADSEALADCYFFIWNEYSTTNGPVPEYKIFEFLGKRVAAANIENIIRMLVRQRKIEERLADDGSPAYIALGEPAD